MVRVTSLEKTITYTQLMTMLKVKQMLGNTVMQAVVKGFHMNVDQLVRSVTSPVDSTTIVDSPMLHFSWKKEVPEVPQFSVL